MFCEKYNEGEGRAIKLDTNVQTVGNQRERKRERERERERDEEREIEAKAKRDKVRKVYQTFELSLMFASTCF
jgi:hypothetical protein